MSSHKGGGDMNNGGREATGGKLLLQSGTCWCQTWEIDMSTDESESSCVTTTTEFAALINIIVLHTLVTFPKSTGGKGCGRLDQTFSGGVSRWKPHNKLRLCNSSFYSCSSDTCRHLFATSSLAQTHATWKTTDSFTHVNKLMCKFPWM